MTEGGPPSADSPPPPATAGSALRARVGYGLLMIVVTFGILVVDAYLLKPLSPKLTPLWPLLLLAMMWATLLCARELTQLIVHIGWPLHMRFALGGTACIVLANWIEPVRSVFATFQPGYPPIPGEFGYMPIAPSIVGPAGAFVAMALLALVGGAWRYRPEQPEGQSLEAAAGHLLVFFYAGLLPSFLIQIRWLGERPAIGGLAFFVAVFVAKTGDMAAYFTGRAVGKTPMAPLLSPKKTWEGAMGGLLGSVVMTTVAVAVGGYVIKAWLMPLWMAPLMGLALGVVATIGDLIESAIKRDCHRKDASDNIPGFGGWLDVVDSVIFTAPFAYVVLLTFLQ